MIMPSFARTIGHTFSTKRLREQRICGLNDTFFLTLSIRRSGYSETKFWLEYPL